MHPYSTGMHGYPWDVMMFNTQVDFELTVPRSMTLSQLHGTTSTRIVLFLSYYALIALFVKIHEPPWT